MKVAIDIHTTAPEDKYTLCIFEGRNQPIIRQYGEVEGLPYILCDDIQRAITSVTPRTDSERIDFLENSEVGTNVVFRGNGWVAEVLGENAFAANTKFRSWRGAVDALMDYDEM